MFAYRHIAALAPGDRTQGRAVLTDQAADAHRINIVNTAGLRQPKPLAPVSGKNPFVGGRVLPGEPAEFLG